MKAKFMNKKYPIYVLSLVLVAVLYFSSNSVANGQILLDPIVPGYAEIKNTLSATGATPSGDVTFIYSLDGIGAEVTPGVSITGSPEVIVEGDEICPGIITPLVDPIILAAETADTNGDVSHSFIVPIEFAGLTVVIQAVDITTCIGSNVNEETIDSLPNDIILFPLDPSVANTTNTLTAANSTPDGDITFVYGFNAGMSDGSSICEGLQIDMAEFFPIATVGADEVGKASFKVFVPQSLAETTVMIQAVNLTTCAASNVNTETIEEPPALGVPVLNQMAPGTIGANLLTSRGHTPGKEVGVIYGFIEEIRNASIICEGLKVGIRDYRILASRTANASGNIFLNVNVSENAAGATVKLQAIDIESCTPSNVTTEVF